MSSRGPDAQYETPVTRYAEGPEQGGQANEPGRQAAVTQALVDVEYKRQAAALDSAIADQKRIINEATGIKRSNVDPASLSADVDNLHAMEADRARLEEWRRESGASIGGWKARANLATYGPGRQPEYVEHPPEVGTRVITFTPGPRSAVSTTQQNARIESPGGQRVIPNPMRGGEAKPGSVGEGLQKAMTGLVTRSEEWFQVTDRRVADVGYSQMEKATRDKAMGRGIEAGIAASSVVVAGVAQGAWDVFTFPVRPVLWGQTVGAVFQFALDPRQTAAKMVAMAAENPLYTVRYIGGTLAAPSVAEQVVPALKQGYKITSKATSKIFKPYGGEGFRYAIPLESTRSIFTLSERAAFNRYIRGDYLDPLGSKGGLGFVEKLKAKYPFEWGKGYLSEAQALERVKPIKAEGINPLGSKKVGKITKLGVPESNFKTLPTPKEMGLDAVNPLGSKRVNVPIEKLVDKMPFEWGKGYLSERQALSKVKPIEAGGVNPLGSAKPRSNIAKFTNIDQGYRTLPTPKKLGLDTVNPLGSKRVNTSIEKLVNKSPYQWGKGYVTEAQALKRLKTITAEGLNPLGSRKPNAKIIESYLRAQKTPSKFPKTATVEEVLGNIFIEGAEVKTPASLEGAPANLRVGRSTSPGAYTSADLVLLYEPLPSSPALRTTPKTAPLLFIPPNLKSSLRDESATLLQIRTNIDLRERMRKAAQIKPDLNLKSFTRVNNDVLNISRQDTRIRVEPIQSYRQYQEIRQRSNVVQRERTVIATRQRQKTALKVLNQAENKEVKRKTKDWNIYQLREEKVISPMKLRRRLT